MVLEFITTERKARGFYCFNWQLSLDSCLRELGDDNPGRCECKGVCVCLSARVGQGRWKESARESGRVAELGRPEAAVGVLAGSEEGNGYLSAVVWDRGTSAEQEGKYLWDGRGALCGVCAHGSLTMECSGTRSGTKHKREAMEGTGVWCPRGQGTEPELPRSEPGHQQQTSCPARNSFREPWCFPGSSSRPAGR